MVYESLSKTVAINRAAIAVTRALTAFNLIIPSSSFYVIADSAYKAAVISQTNVINALTDDVANYAARNAEDSAFDAEFAANSHLESILDIDNSNNITINGVKIDDLKIALTDSKTASTKSDAKNWMVLEDIESINDYNTSVAKKNALVQTIRSIIGTTTNSAENLQIDQLLYAFDYKKNKLRNVTNR